MITLLRGSPFAFLKDANDVLGAEVVDDKEGDSSVTRSKRVRSGTAALVSLLQHAVSAADETCGHTHCMGNRRRLCCVGHGAQSWLHHCWKYLDPDVCCSRPR